MVRLGGLRGDSPVGFMAAVGLARLVPEIRLGWDSDRCAAFAEPLDLEALIEQIAVVACDRRTTSPLMNAVFPADPKKITKPDELASLIAGARVGDIAWIDALWTDTGTDDGDKRKQIEGSDLVLTSGQQRFVANARDLIAAAAEKSSEKLKSEHAWREVLLGPWRYRDDQHSFGWDPATQRLGALSARDPGKNSGGHAGVVLAYWLALEAMPAFPILNGSTAGVGDRGRKFTWPLWSAPLQFEAISSLIASCGQFSSAESARLKLTKYECRIGRSGRYGFFQPAART